MTKEEYYKFLVDFSSKEKELESSILLRRRMAKVAYDLYRIAKNDKMAKLMAKLSDSLFESNISLAKKNVNKIIGLVKAGQVVSSN